MKDNRPVNLDLMTIKLPVMALASILHRISAVIVWVGGAFLLAALYCSLSSSDGFANVKQLLTDNFIAQFVVWGLLTAAGYYAMGGFKHIIQEMGYFESLEGGKVISYVAIGLGVVLSALSAAWIWG